MATKKYGSYEDYKSGSFSDKIFLFRLHKRRENPSLTRSNGQPMYYPARAELQLRDEIYDSKTGSRRQMRYAEGVRELFVDKQNVDIDLNKKIYRVVFKDGDLIVDGKQPLVVDFLMRSNYNGKNGDRDTGKKIIYNFVDMSSEIKTNIEDDKLEAKAASWCYDSKLNDLVAYARVLLGAGVSQMTADEIRWNMRTIAKSNPSRFMAGMSDPRLKRKQVILEAIDKGILGVNPNNNTIFWKENPNLPLAVAAVGVDPVDQLVQGSFTPDGETIFAALKEQVSPAIKNAAILNAYIPEFKKEEKEEVAAPVLWVNEVSFIKLKEMYDQAIDRGIIKRAGSWLKYGDFKIQGNDDVFIRNLKGDKELYEKLEADLVG